MERFESLAPLALPGRMEILQQALRLPEVVPQLTAREAVDLFGGLKNASSAYKTASDLAFWLSSVELGATLEQLAQPIGKGLPGTSWSRLQTLGRRFPEGPEQLVDRIRAQYVKLGGALDDEGQAAAVPVPATESSDVRAD